MKKEIEGYSGYSVNENGNVYGKMAEVLTPVLVCGYHRVSLPVGDGVFKGFLVHRLVASTFLPNPNNLPEVNHKNGNKTDNRLCNLEWVSRSDNQLHRIHVLGNGLNGEKNPRHKLTREDVIRIINMKNKGMSHSEVAKVIGVSFITVSDIMRGVSWNEVTGLPRKRAYNRWKKEYVA